MTEKKNIISYARVLVEVDVAKDLVSEVAITMPYGNRRIQQVVYENVPKFCSTCKVLGHSLDGCHKNKQVKVNQTENMVDRVKGKKKGKGFSKALKHREVYSFLKTNNISVFALLEMKLEEGRLFDIMRWKFTDWKVAHKFFLHNVIHIVITCEISAKKFFVSFVYGLHAIQFCLRLRQPWLVMGDFNSALNTNDRRGASTVSPYEVLDVNYIGSHFTWTNNITWSKIDRAMCNNAWFTHELKAAAKIVNENWSSFVHGTKLYIFCRKLKLLKKGLKELNRRQFAHISVKAEDARAALKQAQIEFHDKQLDDNLKVESIREWAGLRRRSMATIQNCLVRLKWDCRGTSWICNFRKLSILATLYCIWECRNKVAFEQYSPYRNHIISKIKIQELQYVILGDYRGYAHKMQDICIVSNRNQSIPNKIHVILKRCRYVIFFSYHFIPLNGLSFIRFISIFI
ncbi:hypothetical protein M9H77_02841 [Catharanthus roseus]|uniref:Uncharacterized protein n=1 Tax=Catharanthus roseus TaxID=4058 RepID=A0ACC0CA19_CATRO|nr:hypothetical protein M9H77_02841 [Catharanthus roseus]